MEGWPMAEPLVRLDHASLHFGSAGDIVRAVNDVSCEVQAGDRVAITGPSGSGKSSLLALMSGLDAPTSGAIAWPALGPPRTLRPRHIGMAFQTQSLLPALTVLENVEIPLLILDATSGASERAFDMLSLLDLDRLANRLPEELSGGQMQRVAFARALVTRPSLVLADEPTGQLDQVTGQHLLDQVLAVLEGWSAALVIATHDIAVARRMKTNWRMNYGHIERSAMVEAVS
jgi:putative ABC transport system ATP-binding protein/lipoprotein-releasing system ATP-binding protein